MVSLVQELTSDAAKVKLYRSGYPKSTSFPVNLLYRSFIQSQLLFHEFCLRVIIEKAEERAKNQRTGPHCMQVWHRVPRIARRGLAAAVAVALRAGCGAVSAPVRSSSFVDVLACLEFSSFDPKDVGLGCVFF